MKVLMIASSFPKMVFEEFYNGPVTDRAGWISAFVEGTKRFEDIHLSYLVLTKDPNVKIKELNKNGIEFYHVNYQTSLNQFFNMHEYDIYHVFGCEFSFIEYLFPLLPLDKTLFYIQGIIQICKDCYMADMERFKELTPFMKWYFHYLRDEYSRRGKSEPLVYAKLKHVTGRTKMDQDFVFSLNPNAHYYEMFECLRDSFYTSEKWNISKAEPNRIFVTQGNQPIKGAHMALMMVKQLKEKFPNVKLVFGGESLLQAQSLPTKLGFSYASFIKKIIKKNHLETNVEFLGRLDENQIQEQLRKARVFLLPSSIENSSNSLQEAMLMGVPCVSSRVGGLPSIVTDESQCLFYDFSNISEAVNKIGQLFMDDSLCETISKNGCKRATELTDFKKNTDRLNEIYQTIYESNK